MKTLATLLTVLAVMTGNAHAASRNPDEALISSAPRVRPYDSRAAALLLQGLSRSETLRAIIDELETRDVIVYVTMQPRLKKNLAGTLTWLTGTSRLRYVRVSLNPSMPSDTIIATLGHELQHALEVARAASIVSAASLEAYYREHGESTTTHVNGWDTAAARATGEEVRKEIAGVRASRVAQSIQAFNPDEWHVMYGRTRSMLPP